ncbi:MAG: hypothetical protein PHQ95_01765 [Candidatus Gracilibacteria bacterium]|nr:hypothetical protein [Candidatus Gracilibacteria bacterium]
MKKVTCTGTHNPIFLILFLPSYIFLSIAILGNFGNIDFIEAGGNLNFNEIIPFCLWCLVTILIFGTAWHYRVSIDVEKGTIRLGGKNIDVGLMKNIQLINKLKTLSQGLNERRVSNSEIQFDVEGKHYRMHSDEYSTSGIYWMSEVIMELQKNGKINNISDSVTDKNIQTEPEKYIKNVGSFLINTFLILLVIVYILLFIQGQSKL